MFSDCSPNKVFISFLFLVALIFTNSKQVCSAQDIADIPNPYHSKKVDFVSIQEAVNLNDISELDILNSQNMTLDDEDLIFDCGEVHDLRREVWSFISIVIDDMGVSKYSTEFINLYLLHF